MAENKANEREAEAAPEQALDAIALGVSPSYGTFAQSTGESKRLDPKLQAIKMGVFDNGADPTGEVEVENEEELRARLEAAKKYEDLQNAIIEEREKRAEAEAKADPFELERARLEQKLEAAEEYENYSNHFVSNQENPSKVDPVVRNYELKEAWLNDREPSIEHRMAEDFDQTAKEEAEDLYATPSVERVEKLDRALVQAKDDTKLVRGASKKDK